MAEALDDVRASIQRNLDEKKGVRRKANSTAWPTASTEVRDRRSKPNKEKIREYVEDIKEVAATLEPGEETCMADRQEKFRKN